MPKKAKELTAIEVSRLKAPGFVSVGAPAGLALQITPTGVRSWILRAKVGERRRDIGLGAYPGVTLAEARKRGQETRDAIGQGVDPIAQKKAAKSALAAAQAKVVSFDEAARGFIAAKSSEWTNVKHATQWTNTLATYASPVIGHLGVADIETAHVLRVLEPIWISKKETASRVRGRLEQVLDWARGHGLRDGENPARWRGHLDKLMSDPRKRVVQHHPAVPADQLHNFYQALRQREGMAARALEFVLLTAARSGEVRGARWSEFDMKAKVWTVPAARMKAKVEHRVPLSSRALDLLGALPVMEGEDGVFFAPRGGALSDMSLSAVMRRMGRKEVPHGLRSSFRDWAGDHSEFPRELAEAALAHTVGGVEGAYRRGDALERRRVMMAAWSEFCANPLPAAGARVVSIRRRATV